MIHGVELHDGHEALREDVNGVEDGREIHPCRRQDAPKMDHVSEKDRERCEQKTQSQAEEEHEQDEDGKKEQIPGRWNLEEDHHSDGGDERKAEVDQ